ncbi:Serine/threonine-protein kinase RIO3 [Portunus trituberculatus]|uniref:Serine/threonine-protein kinase RIO3 n=1 Tax=Portunus trituberculatus TaxID=210409 RepID=A0A5B7GMY0_PORTR|nr:Serine/threonine-protein kinase RIO3 [Portunus trituberculatus]
MSFLSLIPNPKRIILPTGPRGPTQPYSAAEVVQPASELQPAAAPPLTPAWGGAGMAPAGPSLIPVSPWGRVSPAAPQSAPPKSFHELMSEDLANDLQQKETQAYHLSLLNEKEDYSDFIKPQEEVANDLYLAQVLQYEYDREYDQQLNREERFFNGNSKGTDSYTNGSL